MSIQSDETQGLERGDDKGKGSERPSGPHVIPPPPPRTSISELRLRHPTVVSDLPDYVWGQGDAYEIPRIAAPPSDLTEIHPQLRETVRPGRLTA